MGVDGFTVVVGKAEDTGVPTRNRHAETQVFTLLHALASFPNRPETKGAVMLVQ